MFFSHTDKLLALIGEAPERKRWEEQLDRPFPKQLSGYTKAYALDYKYDKLKVYPSYMEAWNQEKASWNVEPNTPMGVRIATLGRWEKIEGANPSRELREEQRKREQEERGKLKKVQQDLLSLGVHALVDVHGIGFPANQREEKRSGDDPEDGRWKVVSQPFVYLPFMKPPKKKGDLPERDIDGAAVMLAYLLHKGFLKEDDVPQGDVIHGQMDKTVGFGPAILALAKSPAVQAKIRSLDQGLEKSEGIAR